MRQILIILYMSFVSTMAFAGVAAWFYGKLMITRPAVTQTAPAGILGK